ncbi:MAG: NAD(P)H-dependent oxidoreductase [Firmicutes bacterium]|nr:NAD(P)H-dependent oxidoreductase [Bacillota bacterium]
MNIVILNGSPAGKHSITLYTMLYIEKFFPDHTYTTIHVGQQIRSIEKDFAKSAETLSAADLIVFCYPVYTFLVPSQLHRFIELIKEHGVDLQGKFATQVSTSKHFYDMTAHQFIEDNCRDLGLRYIRGLSADMDDLTKTSGQKDALDFWRFVEWNMAQNQPDENPAEQAEPTGRIALVTDAAEGSRLSEMIEAFRTASPRKVDVVNIREFPFQGGCLGCFHCAADGTCIYKDGFDKYLRDNIQTADAIVYAYTVKDHSMGSRFKMYDDRQFCNGHRTVTMGMPVAYLVEGDLSQEPNLMTLMRARAEVGGNFLAGIADTDEKILPVAKTLEYAIENAYQPPKDFYGVGGLKVFRDLIYQMQGLMREDHRFYKKHGFYDFPQKKKGRIAAMYLVGAMMNSPKIMKKIGGKMTEGMVMPYQKVLEDAEKKRIQS